MRPSNTLTLISLSSLCSQPVLAYWRMACSVSQTSRIDPILSPGSVSGHVHKFAGGSNVNQFSTQQSLLTSTCSTCEVQSDKSAYWTPQLYYEHADGSIEEVQNDGMTVYYVGRGGDSSNTVPFPEGFKMISGNSTLRHYDNQSLTHLNTRPIADRVSFRCINEANNIPETHYIHETNCVNGLRAQINFQSCWDGVNLYKPGNTHVAYLSGIDYGVCPPTHPIPIPGLFYEVLYWTNRINRSGGGRFVFANGDATGYGFHGDFLNGWDQAVQTRAVKQCLYTDNGGIVSACQPLASVSTTNFARTCPQSPQVFSEVVKGTLPQKRLPGCNPITSGPADASQVVCALNSTTVVTSTTTTSTTTRTIATTLQTSSRSISSTSTRSTSSSFSTFSSTHIVTFGPPAIPTSTNTTTTTRSNGGIFVTSANNNASSTMAMVTVTEYVTVTVDPPTSSTTTSTATGTEVQTAFVTVFTPVTVNVTSVTDVIVIATPMIKIRQDETLMTYRLRGREVVGKRK